MLFALPQIQFPPQLSGATAHLSRELYLTERNEAGKKFTSWQTSQLTRHLRGIDPSCLRPRTDSRQSGARGHQVVDAGYEYV